MNKDTLRDMLFQKYFEIEDGVLVRDLVDKLSFILEVWKKLHILCEENIKYFDSYSSLDKFRMLEHNEKKYLILKVGMWRYVIIDVERKKNITQTEFRTFFDEDFFVNNFGERKDDGFVFSLLFEVEEYDGDIQELIDFYVENKNVLCLSSKLYYRLKIGDAWTYFYLDFVNGDAQMGFQTLDQFLYERLFLNFDLTAFGLQDAQAKIGVERMQEMFEKIKEIRIPYEYIPNDLYQQYLNCCSIQNNKLKKVRTLDKCE